ncbi:MAG: hypothetical protein FRX49_01020 [Trebouxia sp. A1-2]|nr:MAG: hypothetical protein FRX49_01020 [Trebouxia sp. A1-2]
MTLYGLRLTASVSWPPSSCPTYPGGAPISLLTVCFSMYSPMSIRTIIFSSSNMRAARALASSVLPTPVGPRNRKLLPLLRAARPALLFLELQQPNPLPLLQLADRNASPHADNVSHLFGNKAIAPAVPSHAYWRLQPHTTAEGLLSPASMAPSPFPAPSTRWISSMNRITLPAASFTSAKTDLRRSSNSPLYFAPATRAPMSSDTTRVSFSGDGTSPLTTR